MDNGKPLKKDDNIIYFPGLEKRLLEKGLENLHRKNYDEAIPLLESAIDLEPMNNDSHVGLLLAYFDAGMVEHAMNLAKEMIQDGIGNDFETMNIYIMLLVQTHKYSEVVAIIEELLSESNIPEEKLEHFQRLLQFSQKMIDNQMEMEMKKTTIAEWTGQELNLFDYQDPQAQMVLAADLNHLNIQPYLEEMAEYLQSKEGDPFFKTLILNVLKEHQHHKPIEIQKFGKEITIIPEQLHPVTKDPQLMRIIEVIGEKLEHEDPVLYGNIKSLVERQFFFIYPFPLDSLAISAWAAAFHALGNEYFGNTHTKSELLGEYQVVEADMNKADSFIRMIEEISYRNL
ncbi:bacterial transcriptional activator domain-containing protein [Bacillus sp. V3B]|uniref:tetratricopeptide repeat protein n=1 Tax=Bacillus sp. V3B TaxID=2804915 RepID=UPI00210A75C5|nr:bacterial transcriptional activator domain-containing protein [Bacillus sp. V3B]MCQ6273491.1 bacterial transcriptional activator domain-containing protein [Bacillus sp. V3B]